MTLGAFRVLALLAVLTSLFAQDHPRLFIGNRAGVTELTSGVAASDAVSAQSGGGGLVGNGTGGGRSLRGDGGDRV